MSIFKNSLFFAAATFFCFARILVVQAIMAPQVYFTGEPVIETVGFAAGDKVSGTVEIWNYENSTMSDLVFNYQLLAGENNGVPTELVDNSRKGEMFSLSAGQKVIKKIEYILPGNLESGNYTLRIQVTNARGEEMAWADKVISVDGNGKFLTIEKGVIIKGGQKLSAAAGVYYQPGEVATVQFDVWNGSRMTITAIPSVVTYNRNVGSDIVSKKKETNIVVNPGEKKTLTYTLPKTNVPETYLSQIKLLDPTTEETVSNVLLFRWIISGESARTLYVTSDKNAYESGEEAKVNVQYNGPADSDVKGGTGTLDVKLTDPKNVVIGESSQQIELKPGSLTVSVPILRTADKFKIGVTLNKGNEGYDSYEVKVIPGGEQWEEPAPGPAEEGKSNTAPAKVVMGVIALIVLITIMYIYSRKKKAPVVSCFIAAFVLAMSGGGGVLAATEVTGGCCDTTVHYNQPYPEIELYPGSLAHFSTSYRVTSCGDGLFFNHATYYITEDKEIPLVDAMGRSVDDCSDTGCTTGDCLSCFGANSHSYSCGHYAFGDVVKKLDTTKGYKIVKLGSVNSSDVGGTDASDWPHWVELSKSFTIPQDLGMYGPVRLYVEYVGSHWDGHWHWNVAYQKAYLRAIPSTSNLVAVQPDYCTMNPAASFKWAFTSADASASQVSYHIQISGNSGFSNLVYDSSMVNSVSGAFSIPVGILEYNKKYYWRLMVVDSYGTQSEWIEGDPIVTPVQAAPHPIITYSPKTPIVLQRMDFSSASSYCYSGSTKIACSDDPNAAYSWNFGNGAASTLANDTAVFSDKKEYSVSLRISSGGLSCSETKVMIVNESLPTWQEMGD